MKQITLVTGQTPGLDIGRFLTIIFVVFCLSYQTACAKKENESFQLEEVYSGLGITWGMAFLSSDKLIITQRKGKVGLIDLKQNK